MLDLIMNSIFSSNGCASTTLQFGVKLGKLLLLGILGPILVSIKEVAISLQRGCLLLGLILSQCLFSHYTLVYMLLNCITEFGSKLVYFCIKATYLYFIEPFLLLHVLIFKKTKYKF